MGPAAHTLESGPGIKSCPTPLDLAGPLMLLSDSHVSDQRKRKLDSLALLMHYWSVKWVAIDKVSNQRASKTLINLLIPHLSLPTLSPQSMGQQSPALRLPINHLENEPPRVTSSAPLAMPNQFIDPRLGRAVQGWETEARARESPV